MTITLNRVLNLYQAMKQQQDATHAEYLPAMDAYNEALENLTRQQRRQFFAILRANAW